jgi:serine/threonine protein kinase
MDLASRDFYALMEKLYPKTLKPSFVRSVFKKIASAIHYLHSNEITHNDVKLENIFLIDDFEPILGDFGFARNNKPLNSTE